MMNEKYPETPILMVDDENAWLRSLSITLQSAGGYNNIIKCTDSREVRGILSSQDVSLILLDLVMPHCSGQELLAFIIETHPEIPVIIISGMNQLETAVSCMRLGAYDYFVKTENQQRLLSAIGRALSQQTIRNEYLRLKDHFLNNGTSFSPCFRKIVTQCRQMEHIFRYIEAISSSPEPVLVTGESGVGKELIVQAIHECSRPGKPYVALNAAGLDDTVFYDTLFGHTKGAFTSAEQHRQGMVEKARTGTLFLDEIGDLSTASQVKLLRLLNDREYFPLGSDNAKKTDVRFVFATNQNLQEAQETGNFRKDLYYRLRTHHIEIPPLRKRREDIPLLVDHFLGEASVKLGREVPETSPELLSVLCQYDFPGNIRELRSMIYDVLATDPGKRLTVDSFSHLLSFTHHQNAELFPPKSSESPHIWFGDKLPTLDAAAELLLNEAVARSNGNMTAAAQMLGISRQAVSKRLKKKETE